MSLAPSTRRRAPGEPGPAHHARSRAIGTADGVRQLLTPAASLRRGAPPRSRFDPGSLLGLRGTKFGCGMAQCGACTVHVDGEAMRACAVGIGTIEGSEVTTIEGLSPDGAHPLQRAWREVNTPQCGYCQVGQIMQAAALLNETPQPTDEEIDSAMSGNLCRCGTYLRIREAIRKAATP